jgi:predicted ATPase/DNA-binding SARP family transcriptional activator
VRVRFGVLGAVGAWTDGGAAVRIPDRKVRAVLADLLLHAGHPVAVATLIDDLWGDALPVNPTATLQTRISQLRRALDDAEPGARDIVRTQAPGYLLAAAPDSVDAGRFRALVARARQTADLRKRAATLADALRLWRGPAYADFAADPFARAAIDRLDEERLAVQEAYAEARLDLGEHAELVAELTELVERYPLRQRLRAVQLRALYRAGRQPEALDSYMQLRRRLRDEHGLDPSAELVALHKAILYEDPALAPPRTTPARRMTLPAATTPLIGRAAAMADIVERLEICRLVTLTGAGGVGKTSLALAVARQIADRATDGPWLVELAELDAALAGPAEVAAAIAGAFGNAGANVDGAVGQLAAEIGNRPALIVLDNCEHVVEATAQVSARLLREVPGVKILATSREPLAVVGEHRRPVPPLDLPAADAGVDAAADSPAVSLFVARAVAADPTFQLTSANAAAVVEVCRRLDGLPLALELAASRVATMDVCDLVVRLDDRLRLLTNRQRGVPDRQQTLSAVVGWSWDLLSGPERAVLRRLAPHPGGCTLAAAEAVCAGDGVPVSDVAELLGRLVERSLVVRIDSTSGSRYRLLETVRAYCLLRLEEAGELDAIRARYERYFDALSSRAEPRLYGHSPLFAYLGGLYHDESSRPSVAEARHAEAAVAWHPVHSADGTPIAVERYGHGPPIVLIGGALNDRHAFGPLARWLGPRFTALTYDRRGRGDSGDRPPYAVQREVDDLAAVVSDVGGWAYALGVSSGAVLAAEAAARGVPIRGLVLVEPPFILDDTRPPVPVNFAAQLDKLIAAGRPGDAVELFLVTAVEMPPEVVAPMRTAPMWRELEVLAPTLAYDFAVMGDFTMPPHWSAAVTIPTLVIDGGESHHWRRHTAQIVANALPKGQRLTMDGHPHDVQPEVLGPIVERFLR